MKTRQPIDKALTALHEFFSLESAGGFMLIVAAVLALICANSPLANYYALFLDTHISLSVNAFSLSKSLMHWINDGLMAIFFLLVGLEIKREVLEGELSSPGQAFLPVAAALGGVVCPALIYDFINQGDALALRGWAIPAATDIAFSLGVLSLFGTRLPVSLKIFLTAIAVIDDLAAIIIIALFYTTELSALSLIVAGICFSALVVMNLRRVHRMGAYMILGTIMWVAVLKSGVHATIAGVVLGLLIPLRVNNEDGKPMLKVLEHKLHRYVAFIILPLFSFANAGVPLAGLGLPALLNPITLGIGAGLFLGKQAGILLVSGLMVLLRLARLPEGANWLMMYGVAVLGGIGFTMSFFIGSLAFEAEGMENLTRLGVLAGSLLSALWGCAVLYMASRRATT